MVNFLNDIRTLLFAKESIGRKFALWILIFSSIVTLLSTALQLSIEFKKDVLGIERLLIQIKSSYSHSLAGSLWVISEKDIQLQLDGILRLPDMQYLEVRSDTGQIMAVAGKQQESRALRQETVLYFDHRGDLIPVGTLISVATLEGAYQRLKDKVIVILVTQGIKTFLVSLFILYLFQLLIGRHLNKIASYSKTVTAKSDNEIIILDREDNDRATQDELNLLVNAINRTNLRLTTAYHELKESEEHLIYNQKLLHQSSVLSKTGSWRIYLPKNEIVWSEEAYTIFGIDKGTQLSYESFLNLIHPDDRTMVDSKWQASLNGAPYHLEHRIYVNGEVRWIEEKADFEFDSDGNLYSATGSMQDITESKETIKELELYRLHLEELVKTRTEELEHAKIEAESANKTKSAFLANMSHEIRTPLNAINGMTQLLLRSNVTNEQIERLHNIDIAGQHLLEIINSILDLSKIEAGKFVLEEVEFNAKNLFADIEAILIDRIKEKDLELIIELSDKNINLLGDPTRIKQALLNYAINAVKFTKHGQITMRMIFIQDFKETSLFRFEVQDTGPGITSDVIERLFTAFEQADNSMTRQYGGTGLGLAITKKFAELMGGDAGVNSTINVGSTFWFTAKLKTCGDLIETIQESTNESAETILVRDYRRCKILLADDEPINRVLIQDLCGKFEPQFDEAENGAEAVELASKNDYDLIFMDMQMPVMNGLEAARKIRLLANGKKVPIIALTGNAFIEDMHQCLDAGMNNFIAKPYKINVLFETILKSLSLTNE